MPFVSIKQILWFDSQKLKNLTPSVEQCNGANVFSKSHCNLQKPFISQLQWKKQIRNEAVAALRSNNLSN